MAISPVYVVTRCDVRLQAFQRTSEDHDRLGDWSHSDTAQGPLHRSPPYTGRPAKSSACPRLPLRRLVPTPNIQPNLRPRRDWVRSMPGLRVPRPIRTQILPKDRITLDRLEGDPFSRRTRLSLTPDPNPEPCLILALQKPTPLLPRRHPQTRKIGAPARTVRPQINHEGAETVSASSERPCPVVVVPVVTGGVVALGPHALDVQVRAPALERAGSLFQAADGVVAVEEGSVGEAFGWVDALGDAVVDDGGGVLVQTGKGEGQRNCFCGR